MLFRGLLGNIGSVWSQIEVKIIEKKRNQSNFKALYIDNTENGDVNKNKKVTRRQQLKEKN